MKNILLYSLSILLVLSSCSSNKTAKVESCCKKPMAAMDHSQMKTGVAKLPEESLYNVSDEFVNENGKSVSLKDFQGKITVVSMVFTHCSYACPRLTEDVKAIEAKIKKAGLKDVNYVLVSFDTKRDDPARLREFADEHGLGHNWTLLTGEEAAVRQLSVLLNVQYEKAPDGNFSHSNLITVLDQQGRIATQLEGLQADNTGTVETIEQLASL